MKKKGVGPIRWVIGIIIFFVTGGAWLLLYTNEVRALEVISNSMDPTLQVGDRLLVWRNTDQPVLRGQIVIFEAPDDEGPELVKRVVGIPGDRIEIRQGTLFVNGSESPSVSGQNFHPEVFWQDIVLRDNQFYLLGDNRERSHDSTEFGPISRSLITGYVFYRYAPRGRFGRVN